MESIIASDIKSFLFSNGLISNHQFGFRPGHSTLDLLFLLSQQWMEILNARHEIRAIFLDISPDFDYGLESHRSGDGYKNISKALNILWSTIKTIIMKWKEYGTTKILPLSGRPSKLDDQARRRLIREATKRPKATLKELHAFMAKTGHCVHLTTILQALHKSGLYGRVARRTTLLKKAYLESRLRYAKKHSGDCETMWQKVLWSD